MARPDADALAPFALPLRREADAVIADANGQTVLIVDPSRNLDEDAAERIADLVFACLSAAAPEVGAVLRHHDGRTGAFVCTEEDGRYRVRSLRGTGFWVFHPDDCDQLISGAAPPKGEALPVAWVIRTKDGHVRMWTMSEARARTAAAAWGMEAKQEGLSPIAHPAPDALRDAERYRFLRSRAPGPDSELPPEGLFIGQVPDNLILTEEDADDAIDQALAALQAEQGAK